MKKILLICLSAVFILSFFGCDTIQKNNITKPQQTDSPTATTVATEAHAETSTSSVNTSTLNPAKPEDAVKIYQQNYSLWQIDPDNIRMSMDGYYYLFLDLDFDGILELIATEFHGSGRYSKNNFYRISDDKTTVELIPFDESVDENNQCDLFFEDSPVLYKNNTTGNYEYIFCDYIRAGGGMDYFREEEYSYKDGKICATPLFAYEVIQAEVSESGEKEEYFTLFNLDETSKVDKETYDNAIKNFESQRTNLDLDIETIDGNDYHQATEIQKYAMLLEAYEDFEFDGFKFED